MSDDLYTKALLRLAADAAGAGRLDHPDTSATIRNPACGDRVTIDLMLEDGRIRALGHQTEACILTQASVAVLAGAAIGASRDELAALAEGVRDLLKGDAGPDAYAAFAGVGEHAGRHVCVLLPFKAALEALEVLEPAKPGA